MKGIAAFVFCLFTLPYALAQTGPGGVGNSSNLVIWLRADTEVYNDAGVTAAANGDDVEEWHDQSGNNRDVTQGVAADKPSFVSSSAFYNGRPSLYFDGLENLENTTFTGIFGGANSHEISVFAPVQYESTEASQAFFEFSNGAAFNTGVSGLYWAGNLYSRVKKVVGTDDILSAVTLTYTAIEGHIQDASNHTYWSNGTSLGSTAAGTLENAITHLDVGGIFGSAVWRSRGEIPEFITYNFGVNSAQRIIVENYLSAKYGITVTNDYFAHQATHGNEVAGIGREDASNTHTAAMSADILRIENASGLNVNQEYLLFGHDNADATAAWTTTEAPDAGVNIQRLAREWRLDETGDVGTVDFIVDVANFPALPVGHTMYALMVDSDGDFSTGASVYEMTLSAGTEYTVTGVDIADGDYVAIAAVLPTVEHTVTTSSDFEPNNAVIEVTLNFIARTARTVDYTTADGTALAAQPDYTAVAGGTATVTAGNQTATYTISVTNDVFVESDETFTVTLSNPIAGVSLGTNTVHTYTIHDDDDARKIYFTAASSSGDESISPVTITVSIDVGQIDPINPTSVDYAVTGGTATGSGTDYTLASGTATIAATTQTTTFNITINDDALDELDETIIIDLSNPVNCNLSTVNPIQYTYTILDNDLPPTIQFAATSSSGAESVASVDFTVNLSAVSTLNASATYTVTGTATGSGTDYTLANGTVTILAGATTEDITATIVDDVIPELNETIIVTLSAPVNSTLGANTSHTYTIVDNDQLEHLGPGGVGSNTSVMIWLKAEDEAYSDAGTTLATDGVNVQEWHDQSGNNRDVTQTVVGDQPHFIASSTVFNSKPSMYFDGTENLENTAFTGVFGGANSHEISVFAPMQYESGEGSQAFFEFSNGVAFNTGVSGLMSGTTLYSRVKKVVGTDDITSGGTTLTYTAIEDHIQDGSNHTYWSNGTSLGSTAAGTLENAITHLDVGGIYNSAVWRVRGEFPEFITYNSGVNSAQRKIVENYLAAKYGVTIANDMYAYQANYENEVAGIGQDDASNYHLDAQGTSIVRMNTASSMDNGDFLLWGHDDASMVTPNTTDVPVGVDNRLERIWQVDKTNDVGTVSVHFDLTGFGIGNSADLVLLIDSDDGVFANASQVAISSYASNIATFDNVNFTDGDWFTVASLTSSNILPVELLTFTAIENGDVVDLDWTTATEVNNHFFTVERSQNGNSWEEVTRVNGAGNSSTALNYDATDARPYTGVSYYRLKQTDFDGGYRYSEIVPVHFGIQSTSELQVYPNPTNGTVNVIGSVEELNQLRIFNYVGQDVTNRALLRPSAEGTLTIDLSQLSAGMYFLRSLNSSVALIKK